MVVNGAASLKNNIFDNFKTSLTASGSSAVVSEDYNLFTGDTSTPQSLSASITSGGHDRIGALPRFVDPAAFDYRLQQSSPAIDFGVDAGVSSDAAGAARPYAGTNLDIGAYEYQGVGVSSLSITKVGPLYVAPGSQFRFVLTVTNEGASTLNDLRADVNPEDFQAGASLTYDLTKDSTRKLIQFYFSTQTDTAANAAGLPALKNIPGARAIVDALKANYADPNPADHYLLSLYDVNGGSGHRVTPYAVV